MKQSISYNNARIPPKIEKADKKIPAASAAGEGGMVEEIYILIDTLTPQLVT